MEFVTENSHICVKTKNYNEIECTETDELMLDCIKTKDSEDEMNDKISPQKSEQCNNFEEIKTGSAILQKLLTNPNQIKKFAYGNCPKTFWDTYHTLISKRTTNPDDEHSFSCQICNSVKDDVKAIIEHCMTIHSLDRNTIRPYNCNKCPKRFFTNGGLYNHKFLHTGIKQYLCSFCGKLFLLPTTASLHEKTHRKQKTRMCHHCGKTFKTNSHLNRHIWLVHTDPSHWKFNCNICCRKLFSKAALDDHEKRHIGIKTVPCHLCNKLFFDAAGLRQHVKAHPVIEKKPFTCELCDESYRLKQSLKIHLARDHGIGVAKMPLKAVPSV